MKKISGVNKRHILKNFFNKINTPYDLRINDAIDGEEMLHIALTKKSVFMLISTFLVASFILVSLLFLFTPIKYYIPGFETVDSRKKVVLLQARMDSLENFHRNYNKLFGNAVAVISDDDQYLSDTLQLNEKELKAAEISNNQTVEERDKVARSGLPHNKDTIGQKKKVRQK